MPSLDLSGIDWVIVGGESGSAHRPLDLAWVRDIRDRCVDLRVRSVLQAGRWADPEGRRPSAR
ncbi:DUF5131 family protein [Streptomyces deserti]